MAGEVMDVINNATYLAGGGSALVIALSIFARKFFVNWSKENVIVQGADTTALMMANFHTEIKRLADSNAAFAKENADLRKQISRLEGILEKIAVKFDVDLAEFGDIKGTDNL